MAFVKDNTTATKIQIILKQDISPICEHNIFVFSYFFLSTSGICIVLV
ncbi:Hypothetical protein c3621 [Escherichia coli CFT073]|jgi:hypothetical protein|uniref:Uncharacterized protein n=1 Tax=Escherichia coli O6:H1 (strain CFT073 / ATCC 700928 / UPEC) TaxID=199310 RepID=A0A0H2VAT8_ECOL6|nr:Hypothetical protein c3621 [Escherichia coli CFT073]